MKLQLVRQGGVLRPLGPWDAERLQGFREGESINATLTSTKRRGRQSLYWAGIGILLENLSEQDEKKWPTTRRLHDMLLQEEGFTEKLWRIDGTFKIVPMSTAVDNMDDADFDILFEKLRRFVVANFHYDPWDVWIEQKEEEKRQRDWEKNGRR